MQQASSLTRVCQLSLSKALRMKFIILIIVLNTTLNFTFTLIHIFIILLLPKKLEILIPDCSNNFEWIDLTNIWQQENLEEGTKK